jgi:hypothetical protein
MEELQRLEKLFICSVTSSPQTTEEKSDGSRQFEEFDRAPDINIISDNSSHGGDEEKDPMLNSHVRCVSPESYFEEDRLALSAQLSIQSADSSISLSARDWYELLNCVLEDNFIEDRPRCQMTMLSASIKHEC